MAISPQELQARLAAIVENSDDVIVSKDLNGIIKSWNRSAERIFGWTADEVIGKPINIIIPPDRQHEEPKILDRIRHGERVDHFQTVRMRKDGTFLDVSVTISPVRDETGKIIGASKIARDITEHLRIQRERDELLAAERAARMEAERANRMKDEFISTLSHELRTPLNAILGWSQLLTRSQHDPDTIREGIEVIERNARIQTQLIEDLLDMSRILTGKIRLDIQRLELAPIVTAVVNAVRPSAELKEIKLSTILDPRAGAVSGDPNRLQQVVWNLLTNAIKFTPKKGRIQVLLGRVNSHIEITVSDTGCGIKPEFLPFVFDRFRQADSSITREHGGLGIGLSIVKHLVELHGGTVRVRSEGEGCGATFSVELPLTPLTPRESETDAPQHHSTHTANRLSLAGVTVLVVDDEEDTRELIARLLAGCDANVLCAQSADEALHLLQANPPHVLVSDIGMPGKDGYELIKNVRKLPPDRGGRVPALALTAFARPEDRTRAMLAGYQVHVAKPVDGAELIATVASLAGRTGQ